MTRATSGQAPSHPGPGRRRLVLGLVAGLAACATTGADAQSISISRSNSSVFLGGAAHPGIYSRITGNPVVFTSLPPIGIDLDAGSSSGSYILPPEVGFPRGIEAIEQGYPPYYGPGHRRLGIGGYHSNNGVIQLDYSAQPFYWPRQFAGPPLFEIARRVDPALLDLPTGDPPAGAPATPPQAPEPVDLATQAFEDREFLVAARILERRHEERLGQEQASAQAIDPDRGALRLAAFAYAAAREFGPAAERFIEAYDEQPSLTDDPLDGADLLGSRADMRELVVDAVRAAHENPTPEAWRLVGYLMLADDRGRFARKMFERADELERARQIQRPTIPGGSPR